MHCCGPGSGAVDNKTLTKLKLHFGQAFSSHISVIGQWHRKRGKSNSWGVVNNFLLMSASLLGKYSTNLAMTLHLCFKKQWKSMV